MSKYVAKNVLRQAKNVTKGYTDIQIKVREATSNDPWGPSGTLMSEISEATYHHGQFAEIMDMIDKRLNDHGKNWRHVLKSLILLDYLIHSGSENVISYAKQNLYIVKTLKEFQYVDEEGKDQGMNIRQKSKEIVALLADDGRLAQERVQRQAMSGRFDTGHRDPSHAEEDKEIARAIEESKRTAAEEEKKRKERVAQNDTVRRESHSNNVVNLLDQQIQPTSNDPFGSNFNPGPYNPNYQQNQNPFGDSFEVGRNLNGSGTFGVHDGFGNNFAGTNNSNPGNSNFNSNFGNTFNPGNSNFNSNLGSNNFNSNFENSNFNSSNGNNSNFNNNFNSNFGNNNFQGFNSGFDNQPSHPFDVPLNQGTTAKALPYSVDTMDPQAKLASVARNAVTIDPFASLAASRASQSQDFSSDPAIPQETQIVQSQPRQVDFVSKMVDLNPGNLVASNRATNNPFVQTQGGQSKTLNDLAKEQKVDGGFGSSFTAGQKMYSGSGNNSFQQPNVGMNSSFSNSFQQPVNSSFQPANSSFQQPMNSSFQPPNTSFQPMTSFQQNQMNPYQQNQVNPFQQSQNNSFQQNQMTQQNQGMYDGGNKNANFF